VYLLCQLTCKVSVYTWHLRMNMIYHQHSVLALSAHLSAISVCTCSTISMVMVYLVCMHLYMLLQTHILFLFSECEPYLIISVHALAALSYTHMLFCHENIIIGVCLSHDCYVTPNQTQCTGYYTYIHTYIHTYIYTHT
jgi:hypothetical protein